MSADAARTAAKKPPTDQPMTRATLSAADSDPLSCTDSFTDVPLFVWAHQYAMR